MPYASRNASAISVGEPVASAGSGTPQCAVIGRPGQIGHASPAALSQTVNTKSTDVAPGVANSVHDFERNADVSCPRLSSSRIASGCTLPFGWLPALYARNFVAPILLRIASAMIERAELPVQRNKTLNGRSLMTTQIDGRG